MTSRPKIDANDILIAGQELSLDDVEELAPTTPARPERAKVLSKEERELKRVENLLDLVRPFDSIAKDAVVRLARRARGEEKRIKTPWSEFNDLIGGGFWPGHYIYVAPTGGAKTQLAISVIQFAASNAIPCLYIGLEMGPLDLTARLFAQIDKRKSWSDLFHGEGGETTARIVEEIASRTARLPIEAVLAPPMGVTYADLGPLMSEFRRRYPKEEYPQAVVVLDFLQLVDGAPGEEPRMRVGRTAYQCRALAVAHDLVVLGISSAARDKYGLLGGDIEEALLQPNGAVHRPDALIGVGKESGDVEYSLDALIVGVNTRIDGIKDRVIIVVAPKVRAGQSTWNALLFDGHRLRSPTQNENELLKNWVTAKNDAWAKKSPAAKAKARDKDKKSGAARIIHGRR